MLLLLATILVIYASNHPEKVERLEKREAENSD